MCDMKVHVYIWLKLEWSKYAQKKGQQDFFFEFNRANNLSFNVKKFHTSQFRLQICMFLKRIRAETHTFYHLYTFQFKRA